MGFNIGIRDFDTLSDADKHTAELHKDLFKNRLERNASHNVNQHKLMVSTEDSIKDYIIPYRSMEFIASDTVVLLDIYNEYHTIDDNAMAQLGSKLGIASKYITDLHKDNSRWAKDLLARTLTDYAHNRRFHDKALIRTVNDTEVRAVLSDGYDRYNTSMVINALLEHAKDKIFVSNVDYDGYTYYLNIVNKEVIPVKLKGGTHFYLFGAHIRNSSFGKSAFEVKPYVLQIVCNNGLTREKVLYQTHLHGKINEIGFLSRDTLIKRSELKIRYAKDAIDFIFKPETINKDIEHLIQLSDTPIDTEFQIKKLSKSSKITKAESDGILNILSNGLGEDGILQNGSAYDMVQAITRFSQTKEPERRAYLNDLAGSISIK